MSASQRAASPLLFWRLRLRLVGGKEERRRKRGGEGKGEEEGEEEKEGNRRKGRVKEEWGRARGENVLLVICAYNTAGRVSLRGGSTTHQKDKYHSVKHLQLY